MPFKVVRNDIIKMKVDAIVNPTNRYLKGSDSIDGIIHRAGGEKLEEECRALNGCKVGEAKITNAYKNYVTKGICSFTPVSILCYTLKFVWSINFSHTYISKYHINIFFKVSAAILGGKL